MLLNDNTSQAHCKFVMPVKPRDGFMVVRYLPARTFMSVEIMHTEQIAKLTEVVFGFYVLISVNFI